MALAMRQAEVQRTEPKPRHEKNYKLVVTEPQLDEVLACLEQAERFAFDFETTHENPLAFDEDQRIVGISFSWEKGQGVYLPINHDFYNRNWCVTVLERFRHLFEGPKLKIAHNAKFEAHWLATVGIRLALPIFDTMLGLNVLKTRYTQIGLKAVVEDVFGYSMLTFEEITGYIEEPTGEYYKSGKRKGQPMMHQRQRRFNEVPVDERCLEYTCADSDWAFQLAERVEAELKEDDLYELAVDLDFPLMLSLVDMERIGWYVDPEQFDRLRTLAQGELDRLEAEIKTELAKQMRLEPGTEIIVPTGKVPKPLNLRSGPHLAWVLFDQLKLPIIERTEKQAPSTSREVLEKLGNKYDIPLFNLILDHKRYSKILSTYVNGFKKHIRPSNRIHSTMDMVFVRTSRFSSSAPNLQNCPRADGDPLGIRNAFVAPPGYLYLFVDYSQIELRLFAWYAQEPAMLDAFVKGQDIHGRTAWEMYELGKKPFEMNGVMHDPIGVHEVKEKAKLYRQYSKSINFGIIYGLSAPGLANDLWKDTSDESLRKAAGMLNRYLATYSNVEKQQKRFIAAARKTGYAEDMFGRKRMLPDIHSHNRFKRSLAERQALNMPVQSSASEVIKLAMIRIHQNAPEWLKMVMQIHDELVFEVPIEHVREAVPFVIDQMEIPVPGLDVPIVAEAEVGHRWGEKHEINDGTVLVVDKEHHPEFIRRLEQGGINVV